MIHKVRPAVNTMDRGEKLERIGSGTRTWFDKPEVEKLGSQVRDESQILGKGPYTNDVMLLNF